MNECIIENIDSFFQTYKQSTWEVNLWAYCEAFCGLDVAWYKADHNETILQIPSTEFRVESYADIYCLSVDGSDRDVRMKQRFSALSLSVQFIQAILEERGCMRGHLRMIRTFYETSKKEFGVFLEDDIYLRKNFKTYIDTFCQHMIEKDLDILLIGYLMTFSPRNSYHFPTILQSEHYTFHSYPDDTWGTQGYILSKAHAAYILEKVNELYIERIPIYHLPDYNPDWIITKRGKRALVYPMLAVEEGVVRHDHPGQVAFHRQSKEFNYDPEKYI
jgi:hypothetical protein